MIRKLVRQMLAAQTMSALTVSLCLLIDNLMIGRFLGVGALAAYGLASPLLLIIGALGSLLSAGAQVACSKSLGRGSQEETNIGYSTAVVAAGIISAAFLLLILLLRTPLAGILGANTPALVRDTGDYMAGFVIGAPATLAALILVPFLQMAGQSNLLIVAVLGMTVADVGFDFLNVLVFHGGLFGMGLASALSYYIAMIIGGVYFLSRKSIFKFSLRRIRLSKAIEMVKGGVPAMVGTAAAVLLTYLLNNILLRVGADPAVAAFSVANTICNVASCTHTGAEGVSLTLSGILYNEEDRNGLHETLRTLLRHTAVMGIIVTLLLFIIAPLLVGLFIPEAGPARTMAATALRFTAVSYLVYVPSGALISYYQGSDRNYLKMTLSVLETLVFPGLAAFGLSFVLGVTGVWLCYNIGEVLLLVFLFLYIWKQQHRPPKNLWDFMLLKPDFGVPEEDLLEAEVQTLDDVIRMSEDAAEFCRAHGQNARLGNHLALCIEEMGRNIVIYGFGRAKKGDQKHLSVRLQYKDNRCVLRFRDDCKAFDPVRYMPGPDKASSMGIRLTMHMADEARYTYSLNLNNLMLVFRDAEVAGAVEA